ncbi:MAG: 16S rRNA (uracil(1498)-N(3))-methyltransferase [Desulfuromonadaceae bacterium]|nr:16S rRNA (uracil(1498)-N(3))-methyltransferase [Desulfuromonadaceae bacterium]MDD2856664.1 16S rRNA (uracil(1498)-N(3))-methyltransferase [Desulfuromonadaceae bacterium]
MSLRRFMINSRAIRDGYASFDGEIYNHMVRVLRLGPGDPVQLADEKGVIHFGSINQVAKEWVAVKISSSNLAAESDVTAPKITICQALPKGDKIDMILQKGTELGAHDFWLFGGRRSVAKVRDDQQESKLERWNRITAEAARQSERIDIPEVSWRPTAVEAANDSGQELRLILWEGERETSLKKALTEGAKPVSIVVAIGPEGGFDPLEVRHFSQHGYQPVSLGSRILRTETASIAILAIMQYIWGEM